MADNNDDEMKPKRMFTILVIQGPNLNMLGKRDLGIYGNKTMEDVHNELHALAHDLGCQVDCRQKNWEGQLIDWIQQASTWANGIILNAGGLTHSSISMRDAVDVARSLGVPTIEVHISDISTRESFRRFSVFSAEPAVCLKQICGKGTDGYSIALRELVEHLTLKRASAEAAGDSKAPQS